MYAACVDPDTPQSTIPEYVATLTPGPSPTCGRGGSDGEIRGEKSTFQYSVPFTENARGRLPSPTRGRGAGGEGRQINPRKDSKSVPPVPK